MKKTTITFFLMGCLAMGSASATPFSIKMVADNDFAIFSGTSTSVNALLYQNNVIWNSQIPALSTLTFNLAAGDDTFYVLAMGGGGNENISGLVNGVNMTDPSVDVQMSSNLRSSLTGYNNFDVSYGTYDAQLADVQAAFGGLTWSDPVLNSTQTVIVQAGFGQGFTFDSQSARLFSFYAGDVGVSVSEPPLIALMLFGLAGMVLRARKKLVPSLSLS